MGPRRSKPRARGGRLRERLPRAAGDFARASRAAPALHCSGATAAADPPHARSPRFVSRGSAVLYFTCFKAKLERMLATPGTRVRWSTRKRS